MRGHGVAGSGLGKVRVKNLVPESTWSLRKRNNDVTTSTSYLKFTGSEKHEVSVGSGI